MDYYLGVTGEARITQDEIGAIQAIVMAVSAGRIKSQFKKVLTDFRRSGKSGGSEENDDCGGC